MKNYKLAVIIPSWNSKDYIAEMLDSILVQSYQDWKLFVVDDQSTDSSLEIIRDYAKRDQRISYIVRDREPKGAQTCRNLGFEQAEEAEYVIWFDADDVIAPYCFEQRVNYMDRHPELDFGIFPAITFNDELWEEKAWCYGIPFWEDELQAFLSGTLPMVGWTNIYRRLSIKEKKHHWDESILSRQDWDFNFHSILSGLKYDYAVKEDAKVDYYYRVAPNPNKVSWKINSAAHFESHLYLLRKAICALSVEQKKRYRKELEVCLYNNAQIMSRVLGCYNQLFDMTWVKEHKLFMLRLWLWKKCGFRLGGRLFFREISVRAKLAQEEWRCLVENEYKKLLSNQ